MPPNPSFERTCAKSRAGRSIQTLGLANMGIELVWEEENGTELARLSDPHSLLKEFLPPESALEFACLRFVDPYGDTVFNTLQLPVLLLELTSLASSPLEPRVAEHLNKAVSLVANAQGHIHTYVRFVGD